MLDVECNLLKIIQGVDSCQKIDDFLSYKKILLVTSKGNLKRGLVDFLINKNNNVEWIIIEISSNPDLDGLDKISNNLQNKNIEAVVGLGGGSAMDAAKILSNLLCQSDSSRLNEWFRNGQKVILTNSLPLICIPTTIGSGAEITPFATIWDVSHGKKYSLDGITLRPNIAILDPGLTFTVPWDQTLFGVLDTVSHSLETLWNKNSTIESRINAITSLNIININYEELKKFPFRLDLRGEIMKASFMAGLAISVNRTALAHSISYPLTAKFQVPHGLACSFTLNSIYNFLLLKNASLFKDVIDNTKLLDELLGKIKRENLGERISNYCTKQDVLGSIDEVLKSNRSENFILKITRDDIKNIIYESFND